MSKIETSRAQRKLIHFCISIDPLLDYRFIRMLASFGWCNHSHCHSDAVDVLVGRRRNGPMAYRWVLRKGKGRRRRILSAMDESVARQHTHLVWLVVCVGLGWRCIESGGRHSAVRCSRLFAQRTRKRGTIEFAILDARYSLFTLEITPTTTENLFTFLMNSRMKLSKRRLRTHEISEFVHGMARRRWCRVAFMIFECYLLIRIC